MKTKKVSLTLKNRLDLESLLPEKGDRLEMLKVMDIFKKISITQEDIVEYEIVSAGNSLKWNPERATKEKEFTFTELELKLISDRFEEFHKNKEFTLSMVDLYLKFYPEKKEGQKEG